MSLINLQKDEKIIVKMRRHWVVFAFEIAGLVIAMIVPFVMSIFVDWQRFFLESISPEKLQVLQSFATASWILLFWLILTVVFTNYYLDILIVTNRRVIDVEQVGLFARDITTAPLQNIEDIKLEVFGILATFFRYGNIHIQTAASSKEIVMKGLANPYKVKEAVVRMHDQAVATTRRKF